MISPEERLENEVRRRVAAALRTRGFGDEGIAKEVLYWLPARFIEWYGRLYLEGVNAIGGMAAKSGAGQRGDDEGRRVGVNGRYKGKRVGAGVGGGGKRYVELPGIVRDEGRLEIKGRVDRFLERICDSDGRLVNEKVGKRTVKQVAGKPRAVCDECGKFMKDEWRRCPYHEA